MKYSRFCTEAVGCWTSSKPEVVKSTGLALRAVISETMDNVNKGYNKKNKIKKTTHVVQSKYKRLKEFRYYFFLDTNILIFFLVSHLTKLL